MFTRQHFQKTAETLAESRHIDASTVERFILLFIRDNPRFDAGKFKSHFQEHYCFIWGYEYPVFILDDEWEIIMKEGKSTNKAIRQAVPDKISIDGEEWTGYD